ncbi:uncharacterized protein V6R79_010445 [Siganus canaliculatus]
MAASRPGSMRGPRVKTPLLPLLLHLHHLLLLLLLLLGAHTRTVSCQYDEDGDGEGTDAGPEEEEEVAEVAPEDEDAQNPDTTETDSDPDPQDPSDPLSTADGVVPAETVEEEEQGSGQSRSFTAEVDQATSVAPGFLDSTAAPEGSGEDGEGEVEEEDALSLMVILVPVVLVVVIIAMIVCGFFINRRWNKARSQELRKDDPYLDGSSAEKVPMPMFEEDVPSVLELEMEELDQWMKKDG